MAQDICLHIIRDIRKHLRLQSIQPFFFFFFFFFQWANCVYTLLLTLSCAKALTCNVSDKLALRSQVWPFTTSRDNNFQSFVSQMCIILRKDIWSYWAVLMAWLKLITGRHWQFHLVLLDRITWRYWTVSPGVTEPHHLMLVDSFTWRYWTVSPDITGPFHLTLQYHRTPTGQFHLALLKPITLRYRTALELFNMQRPTL